MLPKKEDNLCGKCTKLVRTEGIQCNVCNVWWHSTCAGIESDLCECLGRNQQLLWYCTKCNSGVGKLIKEVMRMNDRLDIVEDCVRTADDKIEKMKEKF